MPSPGEDIHSWSTVAANNGTADPLIVWSEGQARASVNNSSRSEMAAIAKHRNLNNGSIVTTGTKNAQAFLSGVTYTTIPTHLRATLKVGAGLTNDASLTLNMDGIGDVLVKTADGSNCLGGEFVANGYVDVIYNGTNWIFLYGREFFFEMMTGGGGIIIDTQVFDVAGTFTYTPTEGTECAIVECIGGGGAGGSALAPNPGWMAGGGGGSGGYSRRIVTAAEIGGSQTVTVGAGGAGTTGSGGAGGTSSFGALVVANGGSGGSLSNTGQLGLGGAGGTAGTGDIVAQGAPGHSGFFSPTDYLGASSGAGGSSPLGGGAIGSNATGLTAGKYGSGGSGGLAINGGPYGQGGNGSPGLVLVTEFGGRGAPGRDGDAGPAGPMGPPGPAGAGTGDVLVSGTPIANQIAQWVDTSHIKGINLGALALPFNLRTFTASGTYPTVTNGDVKVLAYGKGGGGSGGGSSVSTDAGGGGGEGEEAWRMFSASQLSGVTITIGAGGTAIGVGIASNGVTGGNTTIFGLMQCNGGAGGFSGNLGGVGGNGGNGGTPATLAWVMPGARGQNGTLNQPAGGGGKGGGQFGGAAIANSGGGGGAGSPSSASGAGGSGFVAFLEFGAIS